MKFLNRHSWLWSPNAAYSHIYSYSQHAKIHIRMPAWFSMLLSIVHAYMCVHAVEARGQPQVFFGHHPCVFEAWSHGVHEMGQAGWPVVPGSACLLQRHYTRGLGAICNTNGAWLACWGFCPARYPIAGKPQRNSHRGLHKIIKLIGPSAQASY